MNHGQKNALLGCVTAFVVICAGCASHRNDDNKNNNALASALIQGMVEPAYAPGTSLARGANEFRVACGRWPKNYPELSNFLKTSDAETYQKLEAIRFSHIEFSEAADGWMNVSAQYPMASNGSTAPGASAAASGWNVSINGMRIAPVNPLDAAKSDSLKAEKTN